MKNKPNYHAFSHLSTWGHAPTKVYPDAIPAEQPIEHAKTQVFAILDGRFCITVARNISPVLEVFTAALLPVIYGIVLCAQVDIQKIEAHSRNESKS